MEKIEIKDMVTLRFYALVIAKGNGHSFGIQEKTEIDKAKAYESYIKGDAVLPEFFDPNAITKEMMDVFKENMSKSTPISDTLAECLKKAWLNADKMKPADKNPVLCALKYGSKYEYEVMYWNDEEKIWYNTNLDEDVTNHVVAWQPISEPNVCK